MIYHDQRCVFAYTTTITTATTENLSPTVSNNKILFPDFALLMAYGFKTDPTILTEIKPN